MRPTNDEQSLTRPNNLCCCRQYIFKYDRSGRGAQVGVIGEEVQSLLPQAVDVVASRTFPNPEKGKPPVVVSHRAAARGLGACQPLEDMWLLLVVGAGGEPGGGGQECALHDQRRRRAGECCWPMPPATSVSPVVTDAYC